MTNQINIIPCIPSLLARVWHDPIESATSDVERHFWQSEYHISNKKRKGSPFASCRASCLALKFNLNPRHDASFGISPQRLSALFILQDAEFVSWTLSFVGDQGIARKERFYGFVAPHEQHSFDTHDKAIIQSGWCLTVVYSTTKSAARWERQVSRISFDETARRLHKTQNTHLQQNHDGATTIRTQTAKKIRRSQWRSYGWW